MTQDRALNALVVGLLALFALFNSVFVVDQREKAVLFQLGEIRGHQYAPGLHFKIPFMQTVKTFDGRILGLELNKSSFLTIEKKNVEVDFFVKWRIADVRNYYRATRGSEATSEDLISQIINRGLRDQFGSRTIQQAVNSERDSMIIALEKAAAPRVKELGIELVDVRILSINLPREVSGSVYARMEAERKRTAAELRAKGAEEAEKIRANADRDAQVTLADAYREAEKMRGVGDAKAADIYARAYGQDPSFYKFHRSLGALREGFSSGNDVLVVQPKGPMFDALQGR